MDAHSYEHGNDNLFHVRELTEPEFQALLGGSFRHVAILRQNVTVGSLITGEAGPSAGIVQSLRKAPEGGWRVGLGSPHTYLLGIASDALLPELPELSVLVDPDLTLVRAAHRALAAQRHQEIVAAAERRATERELQVLALRTEQSAIAARLISRYRDSGSMRMHRLPLALVELGQRVVFFPCNGALLQPYTGELQRHGITVIPDPAGHNTFLREAGRRCAWRCCPARRWGGSCWRSCGCWRRSASSAMTRWTCTSCACNGKPSWPPQSATSPARGP
ncbi:MAG: hypothetical protein ACRDQ4_25020 [Pseudonocardiaceae bacterium]